MAISIIKHDENSKPICTKYRTVALGNHDQYAWTKEECYVPVLSLFEPRITFVLACYHKVIPKAGDISQVLYQSIIPPSRNTPPSHSLDVLSHH